MRAPEERAAWDRITDGWDHLRNVASGRTALVGLTIVVIQMKQEESDAAWVAVAIAPVVTALNKYWEQSRGCEIVTQSVIDVTLGPVAKLEGAASYEA